MRVGGLSDNRSAEWFEGGHVAAARPAMQHPAQTRELGKRVGHLDADTAKFVDQSHTARLRLCDGRFHDENALGGAAMVLAWGRDHFEAFDLICTGELFREPEPLAYAPAQNEPRSFVEQRVTEVEVVEHPVGAGLVAAVDNFIRELDAPPAEHGGDGASHFDVWAEHPRVPNCHRDRHVEATARRVGIHHRVDGGRGVGVVSVQGNIAAVFVSGLPHEGGSAGGDQTAGPTRKPLVAAVVGVARRRVIIRRQIGEVHAIARGLHDIAATVDRDGKAQAATGVHERNAAALTTIGVGLIERARPDSSHL